MKDERKERREGRREREKEGGSREGGNMRFILGGESQLS